MGEKLPDETELAIELELDKPMQVMESALLGKARRVDDAAGRYIEFCKSTFPNRLDLRGLKIVLDCANGATYHVAPDVFHELGAEVIATGNVPDGININENVGSTHPQALQKAVVAHAADLGIAFDGDGDRVMMVDSKGNLLDGDQLLYIIALGLYAKGKLKGGVAGTLMTNLALEHALQKHQIPFERAKVGDRYVLELLKNKNWKLGGENSGHILTLDKHTSGDAIISALQVLQSVRESGKTLEALGASLVLYPQVLINVTTKVKLDLSHSDIQASVKSAENKLNGSGRVLLRASGTEPKIRVMVEGQDQSLVQQLATEIAQEVSKAAA
jgi:phosphoglucosamine mutase